MTAGPEARRVAVDSSVVLSALLLPRTNSAQALHRATAAPFSLFISSSTMSETFAFLGAFPRPERQLMALDHALREFYSLLDFHKISQTSPRRAAITASILRNPRLHANPFHIALAASALDAGIERVITRQAGLQGLRIGPLHFESPARFIAAANKL